MFIDWPNLLLVTPIGRGPAWSYSVSIATFSDSTALAFMGDCPICAFDGPPLLYSDVRGWVHMDPTCGMPLGCLTKTPPAWLGFQS